MTSLSVRVLVAALVLFALVHVNEAYGEPRPHVGLRSPYLDALDAARREADPRLLRPKPSHGKATPSPSLAHVVPPHHQQPPTDVNAPYPTDSNNDDEFELIPPKCFYVGLIDLEHLPPCIPQPSWWTPEMNGKTASEVLYMLFWSNAVPSFPQRDIGLPSGSIMFGGTPTNDGVAFNVPPKPLVGATLGILGSGIPTPDSRRGRAGFAIFYSSVPGGPQDSVWVFDAGHGSIARLETFFGVDWTAFIKAMFLTHLHTDHINAIIEAANQGFIAGRKSPTQAIEVIGSAGLVNASIGMRQMVAADGAARTSSLNFQTQECVRKPVGDSLNMNVRDSVITTPGVTASKPAFVDNANQFTVTEFGVNHVSMPNALGYLINLNGTIIVYSGDTIKVQVVIDHATGADILIHEALNATASRIQFNALVAQNTTVSLKQAAAQFCNVLSAHTAFPDLVTIAVEAQPKHLIITHIVPALSVVEQRVFSQMFRTAGFRGRLTFAQDYDYIHM